MRKGAPMQTVKNRLTTTAIMVCALIAIAFGGVAFAAGSWWTDTDNDLTVIAIQDSSLAQDIANPEVGTEVKVDVIKIADAEANEQYETFDYSLVAPFASEAMQSRLETAQKNSDGGNEWKLLAAQAFDLIGNATVAKSGTISGEGATVTIEGLENGMYLVVPHDPADAEGEYNLSVTGERLKYEFTPSVISLPTKYNDAYNPDDPASYLDGEVRTDSTGEWMDSVTIALKVTESPAYGRLKIKKHVDGFTTPFTAKFTIKSTGDSPYKYENVASVYVDSENGGETVVDQIPLGTVVTVEETYYGAGYTLKSGGVQTLTINSDEEVADGDKDRLAEFTNTPTDTTHGYGIENKFEYDEGEGWTLVADAVTPEIGRAHV